MINNSFIRHFFPHDSGAHMHHRFGIKVVQLSYVNHLHTTNPVKALDIHFPFSQLRKQHSHHKKVMSKTFPSVVVYTWQHVRAFQTTEWILPTLDRTRAFFFEGESYCVIDFDFKFNRITSSIIKLIIMPIQTLQISYRIHNSNQPFHKWIIHDFYHD